MNGNRRGDTREWWRQSAPLTLGIALVGLGLVLGAVSPPAAGAQGSSTLDEMIERVQEEKAARQEMQKRLDELEKGMKGMAPAQPGGGPGVKFNIGRANPRPNENFIACPGFLDCLAEPQLQWDLPKPATGDNFEVDLFGYQRLKFNIYSNFSDTVMGTPAGPAGSTSNAPTGPGAPTSCLSTPGGPGNCTTTNAVGGATSAIRNNSFNNALGQDNDIRFTTMLGYITTAVKKGPFMGVFSLSYAGDTFNDGVALGNDQGPLGPAGQRQWVITPQLGYLQYNEKLFGRNFQARIGRQMGHLGNGIVGHLPRDMAAFTYALTPQLEYNATYVWGATGNTICNQSGITFAPGGNNACNQTNQSAQTFVNAPDGSQQYLEGILQQFTYRPNADNKLQVFAFRMWDTTQESINKNNYWVDVNGAGKLMFGKSRFDYMFEAVRVQGETQGFAPNAAGINTKQDDRRAWLVFTDLRYTPFWSDSRPDLFSLGMTFGMGSGDNNPTDGKNKNFDALFQDETAFHYNFLFSDDIHGYNGRGFDTSRGSGLTNVTVFQPYVVFRPTEKLRAKVAYSHLLMTSAQAAGTGLYGAAPNPGTPGILAFSPTPVGGSTKDIGKEIDVLLDYFASGNTRLFANYGTFLPGAAYGPIGDIAVKFETGWEWRW